MAGSEGLTLAAMTLADVAGGLALSAAAGWNQTADDWAFIIEHGHALGFRTASGLLVATGAAIFYRGGLGWVSLMLVGADWRHRGLASLLMENCVQRLQSAHITPVLDATPAGVPVYRHLGFRAGFDLERWEGAAGADPAPSASAFEVRRADASDLDAIVALDLAANGIGRQLLLRNLLARPGTNAWKSAEGSGFVITRDGHRATQVGPLVARDTAAAIALLEVALGALSGPVFLDVPLRWHDLAQWLEARGFAHQRPFLRMSLDSAKPLVCGDRVFVLAGPEFG